MTITPDVAAAMVFFGVVVLCASGVMLWLVVDTWQAYRRRAALRAADFAAREQGQHVDRWASLYTRAEPRA